MRRKFGATSHRPIRSARTWPIAGSCSKTRPPARSGSGNSARYVGWAFRARLLVGRCGMGQGRMSLGKSGEDLACRELERRGYAIIARRYRVRSGELDVVARDGPTIVFVEV